MHLKEVMTTLCHDAGHSTEYGFVASLNGRNFGCRGPLLQLTLPESHVTEIARSVAANDRLWSATASSAEDAVTFAMCAAHWMDLSYLTGVFGTLNARPDWCVIATDLLQATLRAAGWDPKEMSNLLAWRRTQLA